MKSLKWNVSSDTSLCACIVQHRLSNGFEKHGTIEERGDEISF